jgi:hypothetical protein
MYPCVEQWLRDNFYNKRHDLEVISRGGIKYGPLSGQIDVLGVKYELSENEEPSERQLTDLFVVECKINPWSYEGYGQLLFYKTLFELCRHSKLWQCFNEDFYYGPMRTSTTVL